MSGPPRKPTRLRILEGNPSKRPLPNNEPQPDPTMPECPDWLMADAKEEWHRVAPELHRIGLLTIVDQTALAGYCPGNTRGSSPSANGSASAPSRTTTKPKRTKSENT